MRRSSAALPLPADTGQPRPPGSDWATLRRLLPYLWPYRGRVAVALCFLVGAKPRGAGAGIDGRLELEDEAVSAVEAIVRREAGLPRRRSLVLPPFRAG